MKISILIVVAALFASCAAQPVAQTPKTKSIVILSDPSGARIEVNNEYVGDTPVTVTAYLDDEGEGDSDILIRAIPNQAGEYLQTKLIPGKFAWLTGSGVYAGTPSRIFFNMYLHDN